ncbi:hypothetical protein SERLA73DRAFT_159144 [Serpula lacrymans var. lacrymans S7.3]|uniref:DUF6534 domain-containing protein n=1 Tax=Serpula lacrymans var. lacrymans (strain S7.3) TaxID=936435 RepID=F8PPM6_SERL3|nr:hypothetical protein SERLA73DRAFT_159144 [Serpula lacrymans var. lacrymans S7.3]
MTIATPAEVLMRGPQLGTMLSMILYGITCIQTFMYFQNYPDDRRRVKATVSISAVSITGLYRLTDACQVIVVWILETAHAGAAISFMDYYLIVNFSNTEVLLSVYWAMPVAFMIGFLLAFVVNTFYAWRIWLFSKNVYHAAVLVMLAFVRLGLSLTVCVYSVIYSQSWSNFRHHSGKTIIALFVLAVVDDTLTATVLAYYLHTRRSGLKRTDRLINRLLLYSVGIGALSAAGDVVETIAYFALPNSLDFLGIVLVQMKLYANSFLICLNIRNFQAGPLNDPLSYNSTIVTSSVPKFTPDGSIECGAKDVSSGNNPLSTLIEQ